MEIFKHIASNLNPVNSPAFTFLYHHDDSQPLASIKDNW